MLTQDFYQEIYINITPNILPIISTIIIVILINFPILAKHMIKSASKTLKLTYLACLLYLKYHMNNSKALILKHNIIYNMISLRQFLPYWADTLKLMLSVIKKCMALNKF